MLRNLDFHVSHFLLSHYFMNNGKPRPTEMTSRIRTVSNLKCNLINTVFPADLSCQMTSRKQLVIHPSWTGAYNSNYERNALFFRVFIKYDRCISCAKLNRWHSARRTICAHIRALCLLPTAPTRCAGNAPVKLNKCIGNMTSLHLFIITTVL